MTDDEIRTIYREAADKKKQVQILADLNAVSRREMQEKLEELGIDAEKPRKKIGGRVKLNFDEMRAKELYDEGLTDLQIAECLGVAEYTVGKWRRGEGLFRPKGKQTVQSHEAGGAGENDTPAACQSRTGPRRWIEPAHCEEKGKTGGAEPRPCGSEATTPPSRQKRDTSPYTGEALKSAEGNKATTAEETEEVRYPEYAAPTGTQRVITAAFYYKTGNILPTEHVQLFVTVEYNDGTKKMSVVKNLGNYVETTGGDKYADDFLLWSGTEEEFNNVKSVSAIVYDAGDGTSFGGVQVGSGTGVTWVKPINQPR